MAKPIPEQELEAIVSAVRAHPEGLSASTIAGGLPVKLPLRTLQYRLSQLSAGIDYRFVLADAMKAAGWDKVT